MSNYHLRDRSLSLKAKGLLSLMLSLPEDWDYTMKGLARICKDGIDSISGGIRELEAHGYDQPPCQNETSDDPGQNEIQHEQRNTAAQGAAPSAFSKKIIQFMPPLLFLFLWNSQHTSILLDGIGVFLKRFLQLCTPARSRSFSALRLASSVFMLCRQRQSPAVLILWQPLQKDDLALMPPRALSLSFDLVSVIRGFADGKFRRASSQGQDSAARFSIRLISV